jgi:uncharacterized protein (DUF2225 family)
VARAQEALEFGAEDIVTTCPFCLTTLEDAVKVLDAGDKIVVRDIAERAKEAQVNPVFLKAILSRHCTSVSHLLSSIARRCASWLDG